MFNREFAVGSKYDFYQHGKKVTAELNSDGFWLKEDNNIYYPYFDNHCLSYLIAKWGLNNRKIDIVSIHMEFSAGINYDIFPFSNSELNDRYSKVTKNPGGWLKAYQEIKHYRSKSQKFGSIYHMMKALGALFILNIYYREEIILNNNETPPIGSQSYFDLTCGSNIFTTTSGKSEKDIFITQLNCRLEINKNQSVWEVQCDDKGFPLDLNYSEYDHPDGYIDSFLSGVETKQLPK